MSDPNPSQDDAAAVHRCEATIRNRQGLHVRPAGKLLQLANKFECTIELEYEGQRIDAKTGAASLLTLAIPHGATLRFEARGPDAKQALAAIVALIDDHFGMNEYD